MNGTSPNEVAEKLFFSKEAVEKLLILSILRILLNIF
jgi:hypothetical protein